MVSIILVIAVACCLGRLEEYRRNRRTVTPAVSVFGPTLYAQAAALAVGCLAYMVYGNGPMITPVTIVFSVVAIIATVTHGIVLFSTAVASANPPC